MKRGAWYQFGDRSQRMVVQQLEEGGHGVGVVVSLKDLAPHKAIEYAEVYHELGADVLIDQQFYVPESNIGKLSEYSTSRFRASVSRMGKIKDSELVKLATEIEIMSEEMGADGVIAPAVTYEAGRPDIIKLNRRLLNAAKVVGKKLGLPTYSTIMLGQSATSSDEVLTDVLSHATSVDCDGWYFGYQFSDERIPSNETSVRRCCEVMMRLAGSGKPVLHAFAGPMGLLSHACGATGAAIGHFQNLWQFTPSRWLAAEGQGGGGDAPPRFFSSNMWGTIIYSDELVPLSKDLRESLITPSPFSKGVSSSPPYRTWTRWESHKHLLYIICESISKISSVTDARKCSKRSQRILSQAMRTIGRIHEEGHDLKDNSDSYQANWLAVIRSILDERKDDYDYLEMMS